MGRNRSLYTHFLFCRLECHLGSNHLETIPSTTFLGILPGSHSTYEPAIEQYKSRSQ